MPIELLIERVYIRWASALLWEQSWLDVLTGVYWKTAILTPHKQYIPSDTSQPRSQYPQAIYTQQHFKHSDPLRRKPHQPIPIGISPFSILRQPSTSIRLCPLASYLRRPFCPSRFTDFFPKLFHWLFIMSIYLCLFVWSQRNQARLPGGEVPAEDHRVLPLPCERY